MRSTALLLLLLHFRLEHPVLARVLQQDKEFPIEGLDEEQRGERRRALLSAFQEHGKIIDQMAPKLDIVMEVQAREFAEEQFGKSYAKTLLARSIRDLKCISPLDANNSSLDDGSKWLCEATVTHAVDTLVKERVPECLLRCIAAKVPELMRFDGAGIMCLLAAAHPSLYLDESNKTCIIPPDKAEVNLTGRTTVGEQGHILGIDIGEANPALSYEEAVQRLGLCLGALNWLVTTCKPTPDPGVLLTGCLFVSGGMLGEDEREELMENLCTLASRTWGYFLRVHRV
ncbi:hypothetical protein JKP88DRAFT_245211 [Tribonema minus]|uniref:Uncharacterized protein n=1 Tax=Tribonema minus TaxID=303371 RepID=A0A835YXV7_9STRA|nr:hypothetical protein JKP88DRAFT_245211 [Tribonema minus]